LNFYDYFILYKGNIILNELIIKIQQIASSKSSGAISHSKDSSPGFDECCFSKSITNNVCRGSRLKSTNIIKGNLKFQ
jgi:hypothetical protein